MHGLKTLSGLDLLDGQCQFGGKKGGSGARKSVEHNVIVFNYTRFDNTLKYVPKSLMHGWVLSGLDLLVECGEFGGRGRDRLINRKQCYSATLPLSS